VGLCQVGAFGMAQGGSSFEEILGHYYTGIRLALSPEFADPVSS
jgi:SpoIID/LytB domain protein